MKVVFFIIEEVVEIRDLIAGSYHSFLGKLPFVHQIGALCHVTMVIFAVERV